jgi:hypothetical protein
VSYGDFSENYTKKFGLLDGFMIQSRRPDIKQQVASLLSVQDNDSEASNSKRDMIDSVSEIYMTLNMCKSNNQNLHKTSRIASFNLRPPFVIEFYFCLLFAFAIKCP